MEREWKSYFKEDIPKSKKKYSELTPQEKQKRWNEKCNKSVKKNIADKKEGYDKLNEWYLDLHQVNKFTSAETGNTLNYDKKQACHLLPKSIEKYEQFKTDLENGILLEWEYHSQLDKGSAKQRKALKCWGEICERRKKLLAKINEEYIPSYWENVIF